MDYHLTHWTRSEPAPELIRWRQERLLKAGFDRRTASELAAEESIDFHELLDLIDRGCPAHLAARIIAPLDGGRG